MRTLYAWCRRMPSGESEQSDGRYVFRIHRPQINTAAQQSTSVEALRFEQPNNNLFIFALNVSERVYTACQDAVIDHVEIKLGKDQFSVVNAWSPGDDPAEIPNPIAAAHLQVRTPGFFITMMNFLFGGCIPYFRQRYENAIADLEPLNIQQAKFGTPEQVGGGIGSPDPARSKYFRTPVLSGTVFDHDREDDKNLRTSATGELNYN